MIGIPVGWRQEEGFTSFIVLGAVLVIGAMLVGYGAWVRFSVQSTKLFEDWYDARQMAREGVSRGIAWLLEDDDPDVDWLGEQWASAPIEPTGEGAVVRIWDEGSQLGLNWMESDVWSQLPGMTPEKAEAVAAWRRQSLGDGTSPTFRLLGSAQELAPIGIGIFEDDLTRMALMTTSYSVLSVNTVQPDVLFAVFNSLGYRDAEARTFTDRIMSIREEQPFESVDQVAGAVLGVGRQFPNAVRLWLDVSGPVNVNTASGEVLGALLRAYGYRDELVGALVERRQAHPFRNWGDVERVLGERLTSLDGHLLPLARLLTFRSRFFRIESRAGSPETKVTAIIHRMWDPEALQWEIQIIAWNEGG